MARFIFKMQNLLNIKYKLEEQVKAEYAVTNKEYLDEVEKLNTLIKRKEDYESELKELYQGKLDILKINEVKQGIDSLKEFIKKQEIEVSKAEKKLEFVRQKLNNAMRERKMYESLREKAFEEFLEEIKAQENKEVDELVSYRYGRKASSPDEEDDVSK